MAALKRLTKEVQSGAPGEDILASTPFQSILFTRTAKLSFLGTPGQMRTDTVPIGTDGIRLARVRSTGHVIDLSEHDDVTLLLPRRGRLDTEASGLSYRADPGQILTFRPNSRRTRASATAGLFEADLLMVPSARLGTIAETAGLPDPFADGPDGRNLTGPVAVRLRSLLNDFVDDILCDDGPVPVQRVLSAAGVLVEELLLENLTSMEPRGLRGAFGKVRAAEEIMRARGDENLSMVDLARELGIGLRSLQIAFSEIRGVSPRTVLSRIRLDRARSRLLAADADTQVTMVALDCGFAHLSRFAQTYRRTFGENPSETLARRRCAQDSLVG